MPAPVRRRFAAVVISTALAFVLTSLTPTMPTSADEASLRTDVATLASDAYGGRATGSTGAAMARDHILGRLRAAGYRQDNGTLATGPVIGGGVNIGAALPGAGSLANDGYVLVGAHYDHVNPVPDPADPDPDRRCRPKGDPADRLCNGATDNAAGVAVLLDIATRLAQSAPTSRRKVVFLFWDREEIDLGGSVSYRVQQELELGQAPPVAYVNYDIQGANLRSSLRNATFAIGASSGGSRLQTAVTNAATSATQGRSLAMHHLSEPFSQYRSDFATYLAPEVVNNAINPNLPPGLPRVPSVFLTDGSGPCYHTPQDEVGVVDFDKLLRQADIGIRLVRDLVSGTKPAIVPLPPQAEDFGQAVGPVLGLQPPYPRIPPPTFDDAMKLLELVNQLDSDPDLDPALQAAIDEHRPSLETIRLWGRAFYWPLVDGFTVAAAGLEVVGLLEQGDCQGFLTP